MWWHEVWTTVQQEFSDLPDAAQVTQVLLRLFVAVLLGGLLGYDREKNDSAAGLRTHMLVALGAALFVIVPQQAGMRIEELSRVLQGIIAGIGFLGAGAIIKLSDKEQIKGLTTAASIWATSAIGIAAGMGREMTAFLSTILALVILAALPRIEQYIKEEGKKTPFFAVKSELAPWPHTSNVAAVPGFEAATGDDPAAGSTWSCSHGN